MYSDHFQLSRAPFSIVPDPRYIFLSNGHREALAHLLYGAKNGGGIVLLTGEVGAGKTMVCRHCLEHMPPECDVAYIFNPKLTIVELLQSICKEFRIDLHRSEPPPKSIKEYVDVLNDYLVQSYAQGRHNVLLIDEAQNLSSDVLEQLRLLTNLETNERKLLQIFLVGQPELAVLLERPELRQLTQRVIARFHLGALSEKETASYIRYRLSVAGMHAIEPFGPRALKKIFRLTNGVPRTINLLCDRALLAMYAEGRSEITSSLIDKAAAEALGAHGKSAATTIRNRNRKLIWSGAIALYTVAVCGITWSASNNELAEALRTHLMPLLEVKSGQMKGVNPGSVNSIAILNTEPAVAEKQVVRPLDGASEIGFTHQGDAYRALGKLWGVELPDGETCVAAREYNLRCYRSSRGFSELRLIDRPALLSMRDRAGHAYQVILIGLSETDATLQVGDATQTVSLLLLSRYFSGDFSTLWHAPPLHRGHLEYGDKGWEIEWIASQLAKMTGDVSPNTPQKFDLKMIKQVREFQRTQGLEPDGIIGPLTFMRLNRIAGISEPRLK
jgi:general secretion pathway protein A